MGETPEAVRWAWDRSHARHGARLVLLAIASHGEVSAALVSELASMTRLSDRGVQLAVRELMALGELAVDFRPGSTSRYRVLMTDKEPLPARIAPERPPIPEAVRAFVLARDGHQCLWCHTADDLTIDHIYPWSLGGADTEDNLQTLCRSHNSSKGARV